MDAAAVWWHGVNFGWPPLVMAALLCTVALGGPWPARRAARWLRAWCVLSLLGLLAQLGGLWLWGRDGKLLSYGVLVLVLGTAAFVLRRRR